MLNCSGRSWSLVRMNVVVLQMLCVVGNDFVVLVVCSLLYSLLGMFRNMLFAVTCVNYVICCSSCSAFDAVLLGLVSNE